VCSHLFGVGRRCQGDTGLTLVPRGFGRGLPGRWGFFAGIRVGFGAAFVGEAQEAHHVLLVGRRGSVITFECAPERE
jgi:hypothetical protein